VGKCVSAAVARHAFPCAHASQEYSSLLCSLWFWSRVAAETVLVFQAQPYSIAIGSQ
jgi:hypothetical protein